MCTPSTLATEEQCTESLEWQLINYDDYKDGEVDKHFPAGVDMLPSPVTRTVAAIVVEPPETEDGGKTSRPVSSGCSIGDDVSPGLGSESPSARPD